MIQRHVPFRGVRRLARLFLMACLALAGGPATAQQQGGAEFTIKAKHAIIMDADSGAILFQHNADEPSPPASMSKLMTLAVVFKALKTGQIKPEDEFLVTEYAWRKGGGPSGTSAMFVPLNSKVRVEELLKGVAVQSGNDAAIVLAEGLAGSEDAFARVMQEEGGRIGLKKSTFRNATGLYHPDHLMSVRDLATLARHIFKEYPEYYSLFGLREYTYTSGGAKKQSYRFFNRNPLVGLNLGVDGLKTGFIKESGYGIVASGKQDNRRLILALNGLATEAERKEEARKMLEWGFRAFGEFKLFDAGEVVGRARVWGGDRFYLPLTGNGDLNVVLPRFPANQRLKAEIIYNGPLKPPIRRGDQVAKLRVTSSSEAMNEVPLFAAEDVEPSNRWRRGLDTLVYMATKWIP